MSGSTSFNPVEDSGIYLIRALATHSFLADPNGRLRWARAPHRKRCLGWPPPHLCRFARFSHTRAINKDWRPFFFPGEIHRSRFYLRRHRRRLFLPRTDFTCHGHRFRFGFCRAHRVRHGPQRSPGCSYIRRPADSSNKEFYTGDGLRRDHRSDRVRLCLDWYSSAFVDDAAFGTHLNSDAAANRHSNRSCTSRCRLWLRARRGPSTIGPACQHPAASPTAAADPIDRRDPSLAASPVPTDVSVRP